MSDRAAVGTPKSDAEKHRADDLRDLLSPRASFEAIESFAKYLFTASAAVGAVGVGFNAAQNEAMTGASRIVFALAVLFTAISLVLAVVALTPREAEHNPNSAESMGRALERILRFRQRCLVAASACLGLGLVVAGVAPIV